MRFALYSKSGEFIANVETAGAFTPDVIVWGQRYFHLHKPHAVLGPHFQEAVLDTAHLAGKQEPPKQ